VERGPVRAQEAGTEAVRSLGLEVWDHSPDGLLIVDGDGIVLAVNPALCRMLGREPESFIGRSLEELVIPEIRHQHEQLRAEYDKRPKARPMGVGKRLEALSADGSTVPVQVSLAPVDHEGGPATLAAIRELTDWVMAEQQIASLNLKRLMAEDRDRIARDLHDTVIQELFALGLSLQGSVGLLGDDLDDRLLRAVGTIDDIISSIRQVVFGVSRRGPDSSVRCDLMELIAERSSGLGFEPEVSFHGPLDDLPRDLADDLSAVVGEALGNAIRHADATMISVHTSVDPVQVVVEVTDDGVGVVGSRRSGLANIAQRASRHGGRMELETADGEGTVVRWIIPMAADPEETVMGETAQ
jgi:PAS domain S-box-containing protein